MWRYQICRTSYTKFTIRSICRYRVKNFQANYQIEADYMQIVSGHHTCYRLGCACLLRHLDGHTGNSPLGRRPGEPVTQTTWFCLKCSQNGAEVGSRLATRGQGRLFPTTIKHVNRIVHAIAFHITILIRTCSGYIYEPTSTRGVGYNIQ